MRNISIPSRSVTRSIWPIALRGEDELAVLGHAQPVLATVVRDDQFLARAEQYLARHFWRHWLGRGRLVHIETIIIITVVVNCSQYCSYKWNRWLYVSDHSLLERFHGLSDNSSHRGGQDLYICICNAVTERAVRECARNGACSLDQLAFELGVGSGCGRCHDALPICCVTCRPPSR